MHQLRPFVAICILLGFALATQAQDQDDASETDVSETRDSIRVMSFNLRYGSANDGDNHWNKRKQFVVETIKQCDADITGTQETMPFQAEFLAEQLPDFTYVGRSRENNSRGEQCGIFFRTARFDKLIEGHFWLSEHPDAPGSKSWDSSLPRMVTWLKLWDRVNENTLYVVNTHFDHRGPTARLESAKLIRKFLNDRPEGSNIVVTGDFNAGEASAPYAALFSDSDNRQSPIVDTFRIAHPNAGPHDGTFNGFKGTDTGDRIDWIGASRTLQVQSAAIDKSSFATRFPSDHFPVTAVLLFSKEQTPGHK